MDSDGKQIGFDTSTIKIAERLTGLVSESELRRCCTAAKTLSIRALWARFLRMVLYRPCFH